MSEDTGRFDLTRRRLLGGIAVTGAAASGVGAGTMAYLSDTESSTGNSVQAGTLDLGITNGGSLRWTVSKAAPGGQANSDDQDIHLYNSGSLSADHVEVDFANTPREDNDGDPSSYGSGPESDPTDGAAGMSEYVKVTRLRYEDTGGTAIYVFVDSDGNPYSNPGDPSGKSHPPLDDVNDNGYIDLNDLAHENNQDALNNLTPVPPTGGSESESSTQTTLSIEVEVVRGMPNDYQGDVLETTTTFGLNQDSTQDN